MSSTDDCLTECRSLRAALCDYPTLAALTGAPGWPGLESRLARVLGTVRRFPPPSSGESPSTPPAEADAASLAPPGPPVLRAVHWNIEKANRYAQVEAALRGHPRLRNADLVLLNEVDLGMARSSCRDVAADLGAAVGLGGAWAPMFLELTAGRDADVALAAGHENREGLLGLAVLSRWPLGEARIVELPSPRRLQFEVERMIGRHVGLAVEVLRPGAPFVAVSAHLEVHRGRADRAAQVRALMQALRGETRPVVLAGDFNTHTFDRSGPPEALGAGLALLLAPRASLERRFLHPDRGPRSETLFEVLRSEGFEWERLTDREPTLRLRMERVGETRALARLLGPALRPLFARMERRARLRLDWFAGRGWSGGEGWTVEGLDGPAGASDHAPITAEFRIQTPPQALPRL